MYKLLCILTIGLWVVSAVHAQENSMANVPKSLLECYNNTFLLDRNNKLPHNIPSLLAIIRKIEDYPGLNMDLRTLSVALLHRFRQDGIVQNPFVPAQAGVTPYSPEGVQFHRFAETLRLIPGNAMAFPNDSISSVERCSLHSMLSSSIEIIERGDESETCLMRSSNFGHPRRWRRRSVTQSSDAVDDVETLSDDQLETMSNKDETKDSGVDPNSWYPPLPPNHPDSARVFAMPPPSKCPIENGVVKTEWGAVSIGSVLAGIAAGLQPQNVRLGVLLREEWQSRDALTSTTLDNKWMATIAGNLAEVALRQSPLPDKPLNIGVDGHWNSSVLPRWYFLSSNEDLFYTAAEIRGDLDGLILASEVARWYARFPNLKLSQILDMYYSDRGVFNSSIRACNRKNLLASVAPKLTMAEQTYRSALVLSPGVAKVRIEPDTIEKFSVEVSDKLYDFIPAMNDPTCDRVEGRSDLTKAIQLFNHISTDITIFLDTNWPYGTINPVLTTVLEHLEINKYNSNFTLINAHDGRVMIETSSHMFQYYNFNESYYSSFSKGFNLPKTFQTIRTIETKKLNEEKSRGLGGGNSEVLLIVPYTTTVSDSDKEDGLEQLEILNEEAPDAEFRFLTRGSKDMWSNFVKDPGNDIFSIPATMTSDIFESIRDQIVASIKRVPKRLINSQCGASYSQSGSSSSYDDCLEPSGINFYRLHPNYFYTTDADNVPTIKVQGASTASWTICSSREALKIDEASTSASCTTVSSGSHRITISCDDSKYIHQCNPLYLSVSVNATSDTNSRCTDARCCRYPDMMKFTISYENLVCTSAANSIVLSPIILLLMIVYSYLH